MDNYNCYMKNAAMPMWGWGYSIDGYLERPSIESRALREVLVFRDAFAPYQNALSTGRSAVCDHWFLHGQRIVGASTKLLGFIPDLTWWMEHDALRLTPYELSFVEFSFWPSSVSLAICAS